MRFFFPALRKKGEGRGEVTSAGRGVPKDACFSRLQARGNPRSEVSPPKAPSLAIAMFRNTNFFKDFPMFLSFISICQSENIHPSEVILSSPSHCNSLRYHLKSLGIYSRIVSFCQVSITMNSLLHEFLHSKFTEKSEISFYLTGFKGLVIFAPPMFSGGQKPP